MKEPTPQLDWITMYVGWSYPIVGEVEVDLVRGGSKNMLSNPPLFPLRRKTRVSGPRTYDGGFIWTERKKKNEAQMEIIKSGQHFDYE